MFFFPQGLSIKTIGALYKKFRFFNSCSLMIIQRWNFRRRRKRRKPPKYGSLRLTFVKQMNQQKCFFGGGLSIYSSWNDKQAKKLLLISHKNFWKFRGTKKHKKFNNFWRQQKWPTNRRNNWKMVIQPNTNLLKPGNQVSATGLFHFSLFLDSGLSVPICAFNLEN